MTGTVNSLLRDEVGNVEDADEGIEPFEEGDDDGRD